MRGIIAIAVGAVALAVPQAANADVDAGIADAAELPPYLQCVPYARARSGVQIFGDAHTWWDQAAGRYARGSRPKVGAVMAFRSAGNMVLGHVAAVAKIVDARTVLLDHANWSPINGRRGQIERGVTAIDVSPENDWSQVRVWYAPIGGVGTTAWPVAGFIYAEPARSAPLGGSTSLAKALAPVREPITAKPSRAFADAFASLAQDKPAPVKSAAAPVRKLAAATPRQPRDAVEAAVELYGS